MNERVIEEAISKVKKTDKITHKVSYIGTGDFASKVIVTEFILMKTVLIIFREENAGMANIESYKDRQEQTGTAKERQGRTRTSRDRQGQT